MQYFKKSKFIPKTPAIYKVPNFRDKFDGVKPRHIDAQSKRKLSWACVYFLLVIFSPKAITVVEKILKQYQN